MKVSPPRSPTSQRVEPPPHPRETGFAIVLTALLGLFVFRVVAQLIQSAWPISGLPPFSAWESGLVPYPVLFAAQLVIIAVGTLITTRVATARLKANPQLAAPLLSIGSIYFATMGYRFGYSLLVEDDSGFSQAIPAFFHLVLSSWLIALGLYHNGSPAPVQLTHRAVLIHWLTYPSLIASSLLLHVLLLRTDIGLFFSTYLPVGAAALVITFLERTHPHRPEWQPDHHDVANDLTFMVLVQILLPKVLVFLLAISVLRFLQLHEIGVAGWWPHGWPAVAQTALMLLSADFLRYWLHRGSHEWSPLLWRLHAVHHSPPKLYWVNVGRFHPIEKAVQFLFDAAPFIVLGVSENVLALYFVFYAVNGFFQHCNVEVRLGLLNYIISGPELHRWHHSREIRESNKNYGNNVILWDLLFGSYFLPKNRKVESLGLRNRAYPLSFGQQLRTPFIKGLDQEQP